jgi:predicted transcriptional regulator
VDKAEKVLSVMIRGKGMLLQDIAALSGFSQDDTLEILRELANGGLVKPNKLEGVEEALWLRF